MKKIIIAILLILVCFNMAIGAETFGTASTFSGTESIKATVTIPLTTTTFVSVYSRYSGGSWVLSSKIGTYSGSTISSWGNAQNNSTDVAMKAVAGCRLDDTHFAIAFANSSTGTLYARAASVSEDSISFGTALEISAAGGNEISICSPDSSHFVVGYSQANNGWGAANACSVSGTDITKGNVSYFTGSGTVYDTAMGALDSGHFAIGFQLGGKGNAIVGTISGITLGWGDVSEFNAASISFNSLCILDSGHFLESFCDGTGGTNIGSARIGIVAADHSITWGAKATFLNSLIATPTANSALSSTKFSIAYCNSAASPQRGEEICGTMNPADHSVSFTSPVYFLNVASCEARYISMATINSNVVAISFADYGNDGYGKSRIASFGYGHKVNGQTITKINGVTPTKVNGL